MSKKLNTTRAPNSKRRTGSPRAAGLPTKWAPKGRTLIRLSKELDITPHELAQLYIPPFKVIALRRQYLYRNWDTAFSHCVRQDWLSIRTQSDHDGAA